VEDMIQESMAKGDFDNLSGTGKPLKCASAFNPYVDYTTHKMNQVLIENGFIPEWILLEKEIRIIRKDLVDKIRRKRHTLSFETISDMTAKDAEVWEQFIESLR